MSMKPFHTLNRLPPDEQVHALFLGWRDGNYGFEVTGLGTFLVPEDKVLRIGNLCATRMNMMKGEDLILKRDPNTGNVWVWRVE